MYKTITVRETERVFLYDKGQFKKVLGAGRHKLRMLFTQYEIETHKVVKAEVPESLYSVLEKTHPDVAAGMFETVQTGEGEVAIVSFDGLPTHLIGPWKKKSYWKVMTKVTVEKINTNKTLRLSPTHLNSIQAGTTSLIHDTTVKQHEAGLLFIDGEWKETLKPGRHAFWKVHHDIKVQTMDLRPTPHEITAQEILTKDRVSLRVTLTAFTQVTDPQKAVEQSSDYATYIYRLVQFAVREAIANRTLDEILNTRESVDAQLRNYIETHLGDIGIKVTELGLKDIILPGEMRELINRVVEAEKVAQANLIRRREETAATRSLLNTAKLMEDNPLLLRLKELEALEKLTEKVGKIELVAGRDTSGFDALLNNLLKINPKAKDKNEA